MIQAYSFTNSHIAKAVLDARGRRVKIGVVLDKSNFTDRYSAATFLQNIPVWIDSEHRIAHNKVIIIDRRTLITGSFNFTKAAEERNAKNLLVFHGNEALVESYLKNYMAHREHSVHHSQ